MTNIDLIKQYVNTGLKIPEYQFNSQTKSFEISALEMRRLRAVAEATGLDYEKIADTAKLAAKETRAFEDIKFLDVDSDKKQLVANLAKLNKDGKLEIQLPNMDKAVELTELTAKQVEDAYGQLKKQDEQNQMSAIDIAKAQLSTLESIPGFSSNSNGDVTNMEYAFGVQKTGTINNRYTVYKNPYMTENVILMGFRGKQFLETGAVFAPYIPLIMTPLVYDPDTFTPRKGLLTRYAKKMLRPEFYAKIYVSGLTTI